MAGKKQSFVLYHDIRGPLELLSDDERGKLFLALLNYSESGEVPAFDGALQMAFQFIRTAIDRDTAAWESKCEKRREAGSLGGKQKAANIANATFAKQSKQSVANVAVPVPVPVPDPVPVPVNSFSPQKKQKAKFSPPTVEEVSAYCRERGNSIDGELFVAYYAARGWMLGRTKMKDWRSAVRTWEQKTKAQNAVTLERGEDAAMAAWVGGDCDGNEG